MMNAGVGWYQEKQAGDIVAQLKKGIALQAIVRPFSLFLLFFPPFLFPLFLLRVYRSAAIWRGFVRGGGFLEGAR